MTAEARAPATADARRPAATPEARRRPASPSGVGVWRLENGCFMDFSHVAVISIILEITLCLDEERGKATRAGCNFIDHDQHSLPALLYRSIRGFSGRRPKPDPRLKPRQTAGFPIFRNCERSPATNDAGLGKARFRNCRHDGSNPLSRLAPALSREPGGASRQGAHEASGQNRRPSWLDADGTDQDRRREGLRMPVQDTESPGHGQRDHGGRNEMPAHVDGDANLARRTGPGRGRGDTLPGFALCAQIGKRRRQVPDRGYPGLRHRRKRRHDLKEQGKRTQQRQNLAPCRALFDAECLHVGAFTR